MKLDHKKYFVQKVKLTSFSWQMATGCEVCEGNSKHRIVEAPADSARSTCCVLISNQRVSVISCRFLFTSVNKGILLFRRRSNVRV